MKPEAVRQASVAAEGMCLWVRAMELYNRIMKIVAPTRPKVAAGEAVHLTFQQHAIHFFDKESGQRIWA